MDIVTKIQSVKYLKSLQFVLSLYLEHLEVLKFDWSICKAMEDLKFALHLSISWKSPGKLFITSH